MNNKEITLNRALELQVRNSPDKIFITHKDTTYSYEQTQDVVNRLAAFLKSRGVRQGDPVCLIMPRIPELIIAFLAATRIGALPTPVNYLLSANDVIDFVQKVAPRALISSTKLLSTEIETGFAEIEGLLCIDTDNRKEHWVAWETVATTDPYIGKKSFMPTDVAYLHFTTGTSGQAKGALTTHANIYWNTRSVVEALGINERDVHLCMFAPFAHPHELFARALYTGASLVLLEEINPKTIIRTINRHSITCMMGLAPMYEMMAARCGSMSIPSLRIAESGGMYTRQAVNESFRHQFGLPIYSVWGSTETTGVALANTEANYRTDGSMGKPCPYFHVKLVNEDNKIVAIGEIGELHFKGPGIISAYTNPGSILDENGWFASGDMATMDDNGFYYFVERKSGMIKVVGLKVYPLQIELLLLEHPRISEIAILGTPDKRKGAVPKAYVVINDNKDFNSADILTFCKGKIPSYMIPRQVKVMDNLPKIGSGKIDKKALADLVTLW